MPQLDERKSRENKLSTLKEKDVNPYPAMADRTHTCKECLMRFDDFVASSQSVSVAGRIRTIRKHGGSIFMTIEDESSPLQVYVKKDNVTAQDFILTNEILDIGDFVQVAGTVFRTRLGEKTLLVTSIKILAKAILGLPEKWHGLSDIETRYRKRYLDLIVNPGVRDIFRKRSLIISVLREFFGKNGFQEVETPLLQSIPGGAMARPFVTHHNTLNQDMYLRIAPELFLKRLVVGGFEKVFEIGRCFRNEGIDSSHNPEFTMLEAYMAYTDYRVLMELVESMFAMICDAVQQDTIHVAPPFDRLLYLDAVHKNTGIEISVLKNEARLKKECIERGMDKSALASHGAMLDQLTKKYVLPQLQQPTFLIDHPVVLSPLAKRKESDPELVERFQLIIQGKEIVNAFSELNDPIDQKARFEDQEINRKKGDQETHPYDQDFIEALEHGLPPTAGLGIGIDRLVALFVGAHNLKEVILFPTLKSE